MWFCAPLASSLEARQVWCSPLAHPFPQCHLATGSCIGFIGRCWRTWRVGLTVGVGGRTRCHTRLRFSLAARRPRDSLVTSLCLRRHTTDAVTRQLEKTRGESRSRPTIIMPPFQETRRSVLLLYPLHLTIRKTLFMQSRPLSRIGGFNAAELLDDTRRCPLAAGSHDAECAIRPGFPLNACSR